jgi:hypothetical protein
MPGCSPSSRPSTDSQECDGATQSCPYAGRLTTLVVVGGARRDGVNGPNRWATVRSTQIITIEATTEPNTQQVWSSLQWSGDSGEAVPGHPNQRMLSRSSSTILRPSVSLAGVTKSVEIWVLAATIEIKSSGQVPNNAAPFQSLFGKPSQALGIITEESMTGTVYSGDQYVLNMGVRGKIVAIATISPPGVHDVVKSGWTFRRERWTKHWLDGKPGDQTTPGWVDDTSGPDFLRLTPDADDRIYDTDGPDIRWGAKSYEIHHNFRERVEWQSELCSDYGYWNFRALWKANKDQGKQIVLKSVGPGQVTPPKEPSK